ncbi:LINE-1 retrotransposable element ORF2 protein [Vitis vinifera]|uniref:LINE-1 retrotransposable element ORF2 protein n=1 Tax=Vitis vinifera TaxID=29760 RepID=A0A438JRW3_VITVI|nr:LINE-1 retrotransposable element ORF2 protein [Vitis vinifera]
MKLRLLSWNVRGANDSSKRKVIKAMIRNQKVDLFCLQETKIQTMSEGVVRSLDSGRFLDWGAMDAHGSAGGILICWDKRTLEVLEMEVGHFSISCRLRNVEDGLVWIFTGVHGPFSREDSEALWEELGAIRGIWNDPWCLGGDFNVVDELDLLDLPLQGGVFSWSGGWNNQSWARLDRFLVTQNWLDQFCGGSGVRGRASFRLATKLKVLKQKIKDWKRDVFGRLEVNKNSALQQVENPLEASVKGVVAEGRGQEYMILSPVDQCPPKKQIPWTELKLTGCGGLRSRNEAEGLELPFTEEEIHSAPLEMNSDKALGPDGFTVAFWQFCWDFVKEEIVDLFKEFYEQRSFAKSLNTTFLILIPKKGGTEDLGDFRPISLLGGLYKLLAKVLANRLKKVLGNVVSVDQNAFVRGRQILDATLIANEVNDFWHKRKEKWLICKLDIEKAYDSINWNFLMKVLHKMAGFFSITKGLRQGDPLSPYLFVLGMEVLSALIRRVVVGGFISGCSLRGRGRMEMDVSHLLFADDTIIFCEARKEYLTSLSWILAWFEAASGLRINLAKNELILVGEVEEIEEMAMELGCKVGSLPSVYLGLPLGAHHKAISMWDGVEERMRRRLALWKRQYISKGRRITLIKSTLASIPIYQLSLFRMPKIVARRLEKLQRDFLWGGGRMERKIHLINWEVVCTQKEKGGLGIRKIDLLNKALMGKWIWRFAFEKDILWKKVIGVKYGQEGFGWWTNEARGAFGVGVWKEILKEANWCWDNMMFKVGKGTKVKFGLITGGWNLRFARDSNDWELDLIGTMFNMLRDFKISQEEDSVLWKGGGQGTFGVRDAYNLLVAPNALAFPNKCIWVDKVPNKAVFFAWEVTWGKILTLDRLQKRG